MKDNGAVYIYALLRLVCCAAYVLALKGPAFYSEWYMGVIYLIVLSISNGHLVTALFDIARMRCRGP